MKAKKLLQMTLILFVFWIGLTASLEPQELIVGLIISLIVAIFSSKVLLSRGIVWETGFPPTTKQIIYMLYYIPFYIWYEIKAHMQVIYIILHPSLPIKPGIVKVSTELNTALGKTGLANSITMTPGTLTVDIADEESLLYVHWIDVETEKSHKIREKIAVPFENHLRRMHE